MGAFKPLLPWPPESPLGGLSICGTVVTNVLTAGFIAHVVIGYRSEDLMLALEEQVSPAGHNLQFTENVNWEAGMLSSIQCGIRAVLGNPVGHHGVLVTLADMPLIPAPAFQAIAQAGLDRAQHCNQGVTIFAANNGKLGHPVWIPAANFDIVLDAAPSSKLRSALQVRPWHGLNLAWSGVLTDMDTPDDYRAGH